MAWQVLILSLAAFWPVLFWQSARVSDGSDEPWGVLALLTVLAIVWWRGKPQMPSRGQLALATLCLLIYAAVFPYLPPLVRALIAIITTALLISAWCGSRFMNFALLGLLVLSLPLIASLQFYLGYPLRLVTASIAASIITLLGFPTEAAGISLNWFGETVVVDAPCAGIKMLWSGLYLNFTLALARGLGFVLTWVAYSLSLVFIFFGNVLRNILLFFTESGIVKAPEWSHWAIGLFTMTIVAGSIIALHEYISKRRAEYAA
ncbi:MAG: archaeosortase/exosortase family protein [Deltaproteobacteria bacterium]|nr:archaeosortase/exosortase family protein [Deltaproteobacteria bacterium]